LPIGRSRLVQAVRLLPKTDPMLHKFTVADTERGGAPSRTKSPLGTIPL